MQPVSPWIRRNLRVRPHGLLSSLYGLVPAGGADLASYGATVTKGLRIHPLRYCHLGCFFNS